jgi:ribosomal protein S18 acetylase RimI-like enzyme
VRIIAAHSAEHLAIARQLFEEYAAALGIDLCFQNFSAELANLPGKYAPPDGRLFLAQTEADFAGCVGLRKIAEGICEMKRLYVRPRFRKRGAGLLLANATINAAREIGYESMRLDTLSSLTSAMALYRSLGFRSIPAYYANPNPDVVFMELKLG